MEKYHLVIIGFDEIISNKYLPCIKESFDKGVIDGYSIVDLEIEKKEIEKRVEKLDFKPTEIIYLKKSDDINNWANKKIFEPFLNELRKKHGKIRLYIATELKSHEGYLDYCVENNIPCLVEKPMISPLKNGLLYPECITQKMDYYLDKIKGNNADYSVMSLGRYHKIYNTLIIDQIKKRMEKYNTPITSIHLRHAGGVWNLHKEYLEREDHPYKYGYGMIMHGGYHYIDLVVQLLMLNKKMYPNDKFVLEISSFGAYPKDQNDRISKKYSSLWDDNCPNWKNENHDIVFGETDVTSTFCLKNKTKDSVITLGTISLEQTTPSIRNWKDFPEGLYNKNGRTSSVDLEVQLSTLFSTNVKCYDVPIKGKLQVERIDATAEIISRANASLLPEENYITRKKYTGLFHSDSNKKLMKNWLEEKEQKSLLKDHVLVMKFIQALSVSLKTEGNVVKIDF